MEISAIKTFLEAHRDVILKSKANVAFVSEAENTFWKLRSSEASYRRPIVNERSRA